MKLSTGANYVINPLGLRSSLEPAKSVYLSSANRGGTLYRLGIVGEVVTFTASTPKSPKDYQGLSRIGDDHCLVPGEEYQVKLLYPGDPYHKATMEVSKGKVVVIGSAEYYQLLNEHGHSKE